MKREVYLVGGEAIQAYIPKEVNLHNLEQVYDTMNELFSSDESCFYTADQVKKLKKDKTNKFMPRKK